MDFKQKKERRKNEEDKRFYIHRANDSCDSTRDSGCDCHPPVYQNCQQTDFPTQQSGIYTDFRRERLSGRTQHQTRFLT